MRELNLTQHCAAARDEYRFGEGRKMVWNRIWALLGSMAFLGTTGCINVAAPDKPIVIELNVNIEARLLVELAEDANNTIDENSDIF
jgi:YnbE-like lipoprotein